MLAQVPSIGRDPRGSPHFLAYPATKACMHVLGTGVPRRLGVARSASSPKAARALGCSLTPGLRISFGRVTCMARAASLPGLWTLGFLLLCGACVWVWVVLGFRSRLRPATPGWSDGVCVCLRAHSACTPPLLAGVRGVGVCAWARVSAAPHHSWLRCWGLCVLVCPLRLYPATPGCGLRCACVCSGSVFGCTPPLLAWVLGCVCACVRTPLVPRHSWLGCAVWVCVLRPGFGLRPATRVWGFWGVCVLVCALCLYPSTPGWRVRCGRVCLGSGFGCAPPPPARVCNVRVCALRLYPANPGWGVRSGCVCLGSGFCCALPLLAGVLGCACLCAGSAYTPPLLAGVCGVGVCAWARVSAAPCHSWLGCAVWVCVPGLGFRLHPATPGWGVGVCVCLCVRSACTPPLLAGVCGLDVCALAWVSAAPRYSWLGCWGSVCACVRASLVPRHSWLGCAVWTCVLSLGFQLRPATPGSGVRCGCVCLGSGFGCAPPLLAGVLGCVCACVCALLVPRHSWLGCAVLVCVLGLGIWLRPATPGLDVGVCVFVCAVRLYPATPGWGVRSGRVCLGSGFGCAPPLLAGVCGVGVCAWARVSAVARQSWLGCWGVWMLVCALRLYPATAGWGLRSGCVYLGWGSGCALPLLAGLLGFCVCLCARSACTPPLLGGMCGVGVCAWARVSAAPRHSWLGCAVWVCVLGLGFRLRPATPGWDVGVCVCLCVRSACTTPLLAGVCGFGVCAWAGVAAAPRHSWLGCWGSVCACVRALLVPRHSWLGCAV